MNNEETFEEYQDKLSTIYKFKLLKLRSLNVDVRYGKNSTIYNRYKRLEYYLNNQFWIHKITEDNKTTKQLTLL